MGNLRKILSPAVLIACALFFGFYIRDHYADFACLSRISPFYVLLIALGALAALAVNGVFLKVLIAEFSIDLRFAEYFSLSVVTSFGNLFLPMKGGAGLKAVYLKLRYGFDYSYSLAGIAGSYLLGFNTTSLTALAGIGSHHLESGSLSLPVVAVFSLVTAATFWGIFFPPGSLDFIPVRWLRERGNQVLAGWLFMKKSGRVVPVLYGLTVLNTALAALITWLEFAAFGMKDGAGNPIGLAQSLVFTAIGSLSVVIGITPAALGIKESLLMFSSQTLGISPSQALAVSLFDRTVNFLVLGLFSIFSTIYLKRKMRAKSCAVRGTVPGPI